MIAEDSKGRDLSFPFILAIVCLAIGYFVGQVVAEARTKDHEQNWTQQINAARSSVEAAREDVKKCYRNRGRL